MKTKYGFIGCGNMAGAIINGCIKSGALEREDIYFCRRNSALADETADRYGINKCADAVDVAQNCAVLFLAVKPAQLPGVLSEIKQSVIDKKTLVISVVASADFCFLKDAFGAENKIPIVRLMPNLNAEVCEGMTGMCCNSHVTAEQKQLVMELLNKIGKAVEIEEGMMNLFSAIAGCSPAFTYLFIDSLAKGAQKLGMNKKQALMIAAQAVMGSAKMLAESGEHPWELVDRVCTPAGATIEGICALESNRFESAVVSAVEASANKFM